MACNASKLAWLLAAGLLAACQQPAPKGVYGPERHKVQVTQSVDSIRVPFRANSATLVPAARQGLSGFLRRIEADRDSVVVVTAPGGQRGDLGAQRRNAVLRYLRGAGFRTAGRDDLMPAPEVPESDVLVQVATYEAVLPECPDTSRTRMGDLYNRHTSNHGCATNRNLGVMVANPRDLIRGDDLAPARTSRQMHHIGDYRAGSDIGGGAGGGEGALAGMNEGG
jgi:pilus assembly protein CpaD